MGFHGDWNQAPVLDKFIQNLDESYYGAAGMLTDNGTDSYPYLGVDPITGQPVKNHIAFSPNGDGAQDNILPALSLLRNAKQMKIEILDKDKKKLKTLRSYDDVIKNYFDGGVGTDPYTIFDDAKWNGKVGNQTVDDGLYYYAIKTRIDDPDADWHKKLVPVYVDTKKPEVDADYDEDTGKLHWNALDHDGSGIASYEVLVNNKSVSDLLPVDQNNYKLDDTKNVKSVKLAATDWAGNTTTVAAYEGDDTTIPDVHVDKPEPLDVFNKREVAVSGHVEDDSQIASFSVNGEKVDLKWDGEKGYYTFKTKVAFDSDGQKAIAFKAVDDQGNEAKFERKVLIDATGPTLEVDAPSQTSKDKATLKFHIADNFDQLRLTVNGDEAYNHEGELNKESDFSKDVEYQASLKKGKNTFNIKLKDLGGNVTTKKITIEKTDQEPGTPPEMNNVGDLSDLVQQYKKDGTINDQAAHQLDMQLKAVKIFEATGSEKKVVKHLSGFETLLSHQKNAGTISDQVYQSLKDATEELLKKYKS